MYQRLTLGYRRRSRGFALRPVNSVKNISQFTGVGAALAISEVSLAVAVDSAASGTGNQVEKGAKLGAIYLQLQINSTSDASLPSIDWNITKNPGNNLTLPSPNSAGLADSKRFIFHMEKALGQSDSWPMSFKGVIKLPPRFCKMSEEDNVVLRIQCSEAYEFCGISIYKWYK